MQSTMKKESNSKKTQVNGAGGEGGFSLDVPAGVEGQTSIVLDKCIGACASEQDSRYALTSGYARVENGEGYVWTTDGRSMAGRRVSSHHGRAFDGTLPRGCFGKPALNHAHMRIDIDHVADLGS